MGALDALGLGELSRMSKRQVCGFCFVARHDPSNSCLSLCWQILYQFLNFGMIVSSALMIWKGLMVVTGSESPIVVVLRFVALCNLSRFSLLLLF